MTQAILPILKAKDAGDIINIGSIAGREPYQGGSIYCATKAAVRSFTDAMRRELIATRVRVIEIDPGQVETEFSVVRFGGDKDKAKKVYEGVEPLTPEDIAEIVVFAAGRRENVVLADTLVFPNHQVSWGFLGRGVRGVLTSARRRRRLCIGRRSDWRGRGSCRYRIVNGQAYINARASRPLSIPPFLPSAFEKNSALSRIVFTPSKLQNSKSATSKPFKSSFPSISHPNPSKKPTTSAFACSAFSNHPFQHLRTISPIYSLSNTGHLLLATIFSIFRVAISERCPGQSLVMSSYTAYPYRNKSFCIAGLSSSPCGRKHPAFMKSPSCHRRPHVVFQNPAFKKPTRDRDRCASAVSQPCERLKTPNTTSLECTKLKPEMRCSAHWYTRGRCDANTRLVGASNGSVCMTPLASSMNLYSGGPDGLFSTGHAFHLSLRTNLPAHQQSLPSKSIFPTHGTKCLCPSSICSHNRRLETPARALLPPERVHAIPAVHVLRKVVLIDVFFG